MSSARSTTSAGRGSRRSRTGAPAASGSRRCCDRPTRAPQRTSSAGSSGRTGRRNGGRSGCTPTSSLPRRHDPQRPGPSTRSERAAKPGGWSRGAWRRRSSAPAAGTWTRRSPRPSPSWASSTAARPLSGRTTWRRARRGSRRRRRPESSYRAGRGCSSFPPRTPWAWPRALRCGRGSGPHVVHVYFHDTDLLSARRRRALEVALRVLGRRRRPVDLDELADAAAEVAPEAAFEEVFEGRNAAPAQ